MISSDRPAKKKKKRKGPSPRPRFSAAWKGEDGSGKRGERRAPRLPSTRPEKKKKRGGLLLITEKERKKKKSPSSDCPVRKRKGKKRGRL